MKRLAVILALGLSLTGCAGLDFSKSILAGGASFTAPITNPVTPRMVKDLENGARVAVAGLVTYRRLCVAGNIDVSCRGHIENIQFFTKQICSKYEQARCTEGLLPELRAFVRTNDQVNAISTFNLIRGIISDIKAARAAAGA